MNQLHRAVSITVSLQTNNNAPLVYVISAPDR